MKGKIGRPKKSDQTRDNKQAIIDAAIDIIRTGNASSVTVRNVCARSSVSIGTFYHYFKDKDDLLMYFVKDSIFPTAHIKTPPTDPAGSPGSDSEYPSVCAARHLLFDGAPGLLPGRPDRFPVGHASSVLVPCFLGPVHLPVVLRVLQPRLQFGAGPGQHPRHRGPGPGGSHRPEPLRRDGAQPAENAAGGVCIT